MATAPWVPPSRTRGLPGVKRAFARNGGKAFLDLYLGGLKYRDSEVCMASMLRIVIMVLEQGSVFGYVDLFGISVELSNVLFYTYSCRKMGELKRQRWSLARRRGGLQNPGTTKTIGQFWICHGLRSSWSR